MARLYGVGAMITRAGVGAMITRALSQCHISIKFTGQVVQWLQDVASMAELPSLNGWVLDF